MTGNYEKAVEATGLTKCFGSAKESRENKNSGSYKWLPVFVVNYFFPIPLINSLTPVKYCDILSFSEKSHSGGSMKETSLKKQFLYGARAGIPVVLGYIPVGIAYAVMARQAGFSTLETCMMSLLVYAGAAEMMAVGMYAQGASIIAMILTTFILNLRHIIMSTCVFNRMKSTRLGFRLLSAFGVTDESFAIYATVPEKQGTPVFFLGLILVTYSSWNIGSLIGALASDFLPPLLTASLGIALYAMFIGLLMPGLRGNLRLGILVIFTAVVNTVLSQFISSSWAIIASTLICAAVGVFFVDLKDEECGNEH